MLTLRKLAVLFIVVSLLFFTIDIRLKRTTNMPNPIWKVESIDVMKYSRDIAREKLTDPLFDIVIRSQIDKIASTGASHVAIATPYDDEFIPFLARWVEYARKRKLNVWFRGNFSGWEGWFGYPKITREEHMEKTRRFITTQAGLFEKGDIFTACPECENGGPGDPRLTGDVEGYRKFLIDEHNMMTKLFSDLRLDVDVRMNSSNGDVARLIMDPKTTQSLGGIISVDHYVKTPEQLDSDVTGYASSSGGLVVLGEWGAPIPDIHGDLSEEDQAKWLEEALSKLSLNPNIYGLNYWVNVGGSTRLWNDDGTPRKAVDVLTKYYNINVATLRFLDSARRPIKNESFKYNGHTYLTNDEGYASIRSFDKKFQVPVNINGYTLKQVMVDVDSSPFNVVLQNN